METNTSGDTPTSYLLIDSVKPSDSGKYICHPANAREVGVDVHIQDGRLIIATGVPNKLLYAWLDKKA